MLKIAELTPHPKNPHKGSDAHIREGLEELGQYKPIVVNEGNKTGRKLEILAGHTTTRAATSLGWTEIEVKLVDVDDEAASKILVYDNGVGARGTDDAKMLEEVLSGLPDLVATSFSKPDLDALMKETASLATTALGDLSSGLDRANESRAESHRPEAGARQSEPVATGEGAGDASDEEPVQAPGANFSHAPEQGEVRPSVNPDAAEDQIAYFTVSYTVTAEQRKTIQDALNRRAAELGAGSTQAQALVAICADLS